MDQEAVIKFCKDLKCCDACCIRYLGLKNPRVYENCREYIGKIQELGTNDIKPENGNSTDENKTNNTDNGPPIKNKNGNEINLQIKSDNEIDPAVKNEIGNDPTQTNVDIKADEKLDEPAAKRVKVDGICVCCMGLLQEECWPDYFRMMDSIKKGYSTDTFACGLSAPIATLLREKAITLRLAKEIKQYDPKTLTPLKEAWKWTFGVKMAEYIGKSLDSGAVSPLLITLNMEYPDELQELEILKTLSPALFKSRSQQRKRFTVEFTRRSVEEALSSVTLEALQSVEGWKDGLPTVEKHVKCVSIVSVHTPMYLGGRYIKLCRELPQTPWLVNGVRMMESSVQEIIFEPIATMSRIETKDVEYRLKFMSAGREDVDVRCLGDGRPFAIEITDPRQQLSTEELAAACKEISKTGKVLVKDLVYVTKEELTELKKGEESKCKTYEALCIKLSHSEHDAIKNPEAPIKVTEKDIEIINSYTNTLAEDAAKILLQQKTPIRVLHRRPLLTRPRRIYNLNASLVPGHPQLFTLHIRTEAGTYIKEWVHGDVGRTNPHLGVALGAKVDILALDVVSVHLQWPLNK